MGLFGFTADTRVTRTLIKRLIALAAILVVLAVRVSLLSDGCWHIPLRHESETGPPS
jgi:hypothetical protein